VGLWFAVGRWPLWRLLHSAHRNAQSTDAALGSATADHISAVGIRKDATIIFSGAWFARREKPDGNVFFGIYYSACHYPGVPAAAWLGKSIWELQP